MEFHRVLPKSAMLHEMVLLTHEYLGC